MVALRNVASRLVDIALLAVAMVLGVPALMLVAFYVFVGIGEFSGWYRAENDITMSDH